MSRSPHDSDSSHRRRFQRTTKRCRVCHQLTGENTLAYGRTLLIQQPCLTAFLPRMIVFPFFLPCYASFSFAVVLVHISSLNPSIDLALVFAHRLLFDKVEPVDAIYSTFPEHSVSRYSRYLTSRNDNRSGANGRTKKRSTSGQIRPPNTHPTAADPMICTDV